MATAGRNKGRARFTAACGVLSRYVKEAAEQAAAAETDARSAAMVALPLMPGADVSQTMQEQREPGPPGSCASQAQMTIIYGARVLVLDDVPADRAAKLLRLAAETATKGTGQNGQMLPAVDADIPVARKASLQRFMEKRKVRVAARAAPYLRPDHGAGAACTDHLSLAL